MPWECVGNLKIFSASLDVTLLCSSQAWFLLKSFRATFGQNSLILDQTSKRFYKFHSSPNQRQLSKALYGEHAATCLVCWSVSSWRETFISSTGGSLFDGVALPRFHADHSSSRQNSSCVSVREPCVILIDGPPSAGPRHSGHALASAFAPLARAALLKSRSESKHPHTVFTPHSADVLCAVENEGNIEHESQKVNKSTREGLNGEAAPGSGDVIYHKHQTAWQILKHAVCHNTGKISCGWFFVEKSRLMAKHVNSSNVLSVWLSVYLSIYISIYLYIYRYINNISK